MSNRIRNLSVFDFKLDPISTEICIAVYPERLASMTQVRGSVTGPHCPYATTIEVAYPVREVSREYEKYGIPHITCRATIPEPNLWDPVSPFLYQITVELWQDGQFCERKEFKHALWEVKLGANGLTWNGQPLTLLGVRWSGDLESEASHLRRSGYNAILAPVLSETSGFWEAADRLGFLVISEVAGKQEISQAHAVGRRPSRLGWLVTRNFLDQEVLRILAEALLHVEGQLLGLQLEQPPLASLPEMISFVACEESALPSLTSLALPKLILRSEDGAGTREGTESAPPPGILGWID